jgi:hypothetical protein
VRGRMYEVRLGVVSQSHCWKLEKAMLMSNFQRPCAEVSNDFVEDIAEKVVRTKSRDYFNLSEYRRLPLFFSRETQYHRKLNSLSAICSRSFNDDYSTLGF